MAMTGWWRVDPDTGETLGMTAHGHGSEVVEYLMDATSMAFGMVQALGSLKSCTELADDLQQMCCLVEAHLNNVAGLGFGSIIGTGLDSAGGALIDILEYGLGHAAGAALGKDHGLGLAPQASLSCDAVQATPW